MATPYDAPIPGADTYATAALGAKTAYQNALTRINSKRQDTLRTYGYLGDIDPNSGALSNLRVDPYNQFGGLQQMLRSNADEVDQARMAAEERGLHGGLAHKGLSDARYDFGNASQQLGTSLSGTLGGYQDDQNSAAYTRDQSLYQAELDAARLAIENQQFNPADTSDTGDTSDNNPSGADGAGGSSSPSIFISDLVKRGLTAKQAAGVDPGIGAALMATKAAAPGSSIPYVNSPGRNPTSAKKTTTAAAKIVAAAKKKGGK
jgi:hypothetical protein